MIGGRGHRSHGPRDFEVELFDGGLKGSGLEAVGVTIAAFDVSFVGIGLDVLDSFEEHGGVHEEFADFRDGIFESVFKKEVDKIGRLVILTLFVHAFCCSDSHLQQ
jgi:hypothetical protein